MPPISLASQRIHEAQRPNGSSPLSALSSLHAVVKKLEESSPSSARLENSTPRSMPRGRSNSLLPPPTTVQTSGSGSSTPTSARRHSIAGSTPSPGRKNWTAVKNAVSLGAAMSSASTPSPDTPTHGAAEEALAVERLLLSDAIDIICEGPVDKEDHCPWRSHQVSHAITSPEKNRHTQRSHTARGARTR